MLLKHATRTVKAIVKDIPSRLTLRRPVPAPAPGQLVANDIGRVKIRTAEPLPVDSYADSRRTGSFLLIDPADGTTLTAGMAGESFAVAAEPVTGRRRGRRRLGLLIMNVSADRVYSTFAKEGGRVGSGALGSGQGGVARCAR